MIPTIEDSSEPSGFRAIVISDPSPNASSSSTTNTTATAALRAKHPYSWSNRPVSSPSCHHRSSNYPRLTISQTERSLSSVSSEVTGGSRCSENTSNSPRPLSTPISELRSSPNSIKSKSTSVRSWSLLSLINYLHGLPLTPEKGNLCSDTYKTQKPVTHVLVFDSYRLEKGKACTGWILRTD